MKSPATVDQLRQAAFSVRDFVDTHEPTPYSNYFGDFLVYRATLEVPRTIGERNANYLRLLKGLGGHLIAGATYSEFGLEPDPVTDIAQEIPLRHIAIRAEAQSTYTFNGGLDARDQPLTADMVDELLIDLASAH